MLRSGKQFAAVGCRVGRRNLPFRPQAMPPPSSGVVVRGQLVGFTPASFGGGLSTQATAAHFSAARGSMTAAHRGQRSEIPGVGMSGRWETGPQSALGSVDVVSMATRAISSGPFSGPFSPGSPIKPRKEKKDKPSLSNRYISPPEDGLTRYPTFRSPQGVLRGLDYMGTAVFALSGTVTAGQVGMDLLGCVIVGTITATGGGTVRDLLLGNTPVSWMHETEYLWMCVLTSLGVFFAWSYLAEQGVRDDMAVLNWADAMGVGAFCCIGAQAGVRKGLSKIVCVLCGMLTSTFGGVIRDVLCGRPPRILFSHAEIYASTALLGSTVYIFSRAAGFSPVGRIACGFFAASSLRVLAFTTDIRLPSWSQPSSVVIQEIEDDEHKDSASKNTTGAANASEGTTPPQQTA